MRYPIFDADGVFLDTYNLNWNIIKTMFPKETEERYRLLHHLGNVHENPIINLTDKHKFTYLEHYRAALDIEHIREARPHLVKLAERYPLQIVTSNGENVIEPLLEAAGLLGHFHHVLGYFADPSKVAKLQYLVDYYDVKPANCVFVTDTIGDIKEAQRVGVRTVAVTFGYHREAEFNNPKLLLKPPDFIARNWEEVLDIINFHND